jgi:hypothetical protein
LHSAHDRTRSHSGSLKDAIHGYEAYCDVTIRSALDSQAIKLFQLDFHPNELKTTFPRVYDGLFPEGTLLTAPVTNGETPPDD